MDASVWLASVSPGEPHYQSSRALLEALLRRRAAFVQPELFMVEVVGTVARRSKDPDYALTMAREALALPRLRVASSGEPATTAAIHAALRIYREDIPHIPVHHQMIPWAMQKGVNTVHMANNQLVVKWVRLD